MIAPTINRTRRARTYVTVYLDMLGLGDQLVDFDELWKADVEKEATQESFNDIVGHIHAFRTTVFTFWKMLDSPPASWANLTSELNAAMRQTLKHESVLQFGGDSVVISIPLQDDNKPATWRAIQFALGTAALTQVTLLSRHQMLRGGIDIGWGHVPYEPPHDNEVLGAGLALAVRAEKRAKYPRVLVGSNVKQFIETMAAKASDAEEQTVDNRLASQVLDRFRLDRDGELFLDFLGPYYASAIQKTGSINAVFESAADTALRGMQLAEKKHDGRIWEKFFWLHQYVEEAKTRLSPNTPPPSPDPDT